MATLLPLYALSPRTAARGSFMVGVVLATAACHAKIEASSSRAAQTQNAAKDPATPPGADAGTGSAASDDRGGSGGAAAVASESRAEPVQVRNGFEFSRSYVQSRAPITIAIKPELAAPGDRFSLFNDSKAAALITQQGLALTDDPDGDEQVRAYSLLDRNRVGAALASYDLTLVLYPLDPDFGAKFGYGINQLRLLVDGANEQRTATVAVARADFLFVSQAGGAFAASTQRANGLEAHFGGLFKTSVTNGRSVLTVGKLSLINR